MFKSVYDFCDVVSGLVYCADDNSSLLIPAEDGTNDLILPCAKPKADGWVLALRRMMKEYFNLDVNMTESTLKVYRIWNPTTNTYINHVVFKVPVTLDKKKNLKSTPKVKGKMRWVEDAEMVKLSDQGSLKSPEIVDFAASVKKSMLNNPIKSEQSWPVIINYRPLETLVEVLDSHIIVQTEPKGNAALTPHEQLVKAAGFERHEQCILYQHFMLLCYPYMYMSKQVFINLALKIGWPKDQVADLFRAADIFGQNALSFRDYILMMAAVEPSTLHGGPPAEVRCHYIFRFNAKNNDGKMEYTDFKTIIMETYKAQNQPVDSASINRETDVWAKNMGLEPGETITLDNFVRAVGDLKLRGTSVLLRAPTSILVHIREMREAFQPKKAPQEIKKLTNTTGASTSSIEGGAQEDENEDHAMKMRKTDGLLDVDPPNQMDNGAQQGTSDNENAITKSEEIQKMDKSTSNFIPNTTGFYNLGLTCYSNSSVQLILHTPSIVDWLVTEGPHHNSCDDIAKTEEAKSIGEEDVSLHGSEKTQQRCLNDEDEARLLSCLDEIRNVIGETVPESSLVDAVLKNNFNCNKALDAVLSANTTEETDDSSRNPRCIINAINEVFASCKPEAGSKIKPLPIYYELKSIGKQFKYKQQEDAAEYLGALLYCIENEYERLDTQKSRKSLLGKLTNVLNVEVSCPCKKLNVKTEEHTSFILSIKHDLGTAVRDYFQSEVLEDCLCENCHSKGTTVKMTQLVKTSNVMIFLLKRFDTRGNKIHDKIEIPLQFIIPEEIYAKQPTTEDTYDLIGAIEHVGSSLKRGHYICFCRTSHDEFYLFNDSYVEKANVQRFCNFEPYILLYERSNGLNNSASEDSGEDDTTDEDNDTLKATGKTEEKNHEETQEDKDSETENQVDKTKRKSLFGCNICAITTAGNMKVIEKTDEEESDPMVNGHNTIAATNSITNGLPTTNGHEEHNGVIDSNSDYTTASTTSSDSLSVSKSQESNKSSANSVINGENGSEENIVEKGEVEATKEKEKDDKKDDHEIVLIQDLGFTVKIVSPGTEPFDIQVSSMELVQEIHQLLMDREDTCHRTCFSLQLDGNTLDNFAELKNIEGLKEGSIIKVVEEPYTMREARIHVRHVRDLLKSLDPADAFNDVDCSSLSFLNVVTQGDILEKKKTRPESVDCTPPDFIMPGGKERPLMPLQPQYKEQKGPQTVKVLTTSGWNPPPGYRKMHGDLMYLYLVTLEEKHHHITACARGFFVNQSSEEDFNPKPATPSHLCHSLIELLNQISPAFKHNFSILQKKRTQRHPFERVATPYQLYSWTAPQLEHTIDAIRAEDTFSSKLGYEEHIPGQTRDWNEELQTTRELPRKILPERLLRERAIFKVHSDFVAAATRGAMAVIDGNVMAINPGEEAKMQMFIWNNIFFSLGFDVRDHYKELGGDAAAFIAPRNDLQGVRVYSAVDLQGLYTLGTVVIDYRGYRVTAQSIIPGILEREQEQSVVYGSIDFGKTVISHPKYLELLNKAGQQLKILPHKVYNDKKEVIELCSSVECKGIIGNDGRHYILDLLRTFPPDVNFLKLEGEELSKDVQAKGFPIEHKHKLCCLRQELIDSFVESRYMLFIKYAAYHLQALGAKKQRERESRNSQDREIVQKLEKEENKNKDKAIENSKKEKPDNEKAQGDKENSAIENQMETDEAKKIVESITDSITSGEKQELEESTKEIVKKAAIAVGSLKKTEFDVRFNPDVYSPGVQHYDPDAKQLTKQRQLVKDAADFLLTVQIPAFLRDCLDHSAAPMDGMTLSEALHNRGINIRYLGKIADELSEMKQLEYLYNIAVSELIIRAVKHIFTVYMQSTELPCLSAAVSHFLNCFLSSCPVPHPHQAADELQSKTAKRRSKRKGRSNPLKDSDSMEWANLTPKSLWSQIKSEMKSYYDWDLQADSPESVVENFSLQKISLLRSFCIRTGVQILLREYSFDSKNRLTFFEEDIINIFPVVKHINPRATDAYNFYTTGQTKIQQGYLKEGYELISEALNLLNNVYGAMHPEIAQCLRMLARLNYIMGEHAEAMAYQQKAVLMSERVNGIDHPYTITEYTHLALYCFANNQESTALKLLYRARYLALLVCGEHHPEIALLDSNISLILHAVGEYELSLRFLEKVLALNIRYYGAKSLKVAVSYHLVARTQSCMGDFRSALNNEKETYAIYKQQLGENHEKTRESSDCLSHLTSQAVVLQKKMNEIYTGKSNTGAATNRKRKLNVTASSAVCKTLDKHCRIGAYDEGPSKLAPALKRRHHLVESRECKSRENFMAKRIKINMKINKRMEEEYKRAATEVEDLLAHLPAIP